MKFSILIFFLYITVLFSCSNGPVKTNAGTDQRETDQFEYTFKSAHPAAQRFMDEDFYWSPVEETAPFGSDDGFDAAYGFRDWRKTNKNSSPVNYLKGLIRRWSYPYFDFHEMDTVKIKAYMTSKANPGESEIAQQVKLMQEANKRMVDTSMKNISDKELREIIIQSSNDMGGIFLLGIDNAIIGIGFAQFVLEGHIENDIKALTITAITRQLLPMLINRYDSKYRDTRKQQLTKMLSIVKSI